MVLSLNEAEVVRKVISQHLALLLGALTSNLSHSGVSQWYLHRSLTL